MFTGIIETVGTISAINSHQNNVTYTVQSSFSNELKIDQSVAHNGVCLTVVEIFDNKHVVTAIQETINKTTLGLWKIGDKVNIERAMKLGDRLDGHIVQGHVDQTAVCKSIQEKSGSWEFTFEYDTALNNITIEKGSITVNGTSLTVVNSAKNSFSVAIIPYTYEHTVFHTFEIGTKVNLEFDVVGKYIARMYELRG
jgi:riboflavin synthase